MACRSNAKSTAARFWRAESSKDKNETLFHSEQCSVSRTIYIVCKHDRRTKTEAYAIVEIRVEKLLAN